MVSNNQTDDVIGSGIFIDCQKIAKGLKITPCSEYALNSLAIDEPLEYARLFLVGNMKMWIDVENSLE